ncbi:MAG: hypothetical protein CMJ20_01340 [Phycisphaeraceae bacterium]|nr:hypothetical protein [Phycisphaeraceae bacterium]
MTVYRRAVEVLGVCLLGVHFVGSFSGCKMAGVVAHGLFPQMVKAQYHLPQRATLVWVEDPSSQFADLYMKDRIAVEVDRLLAHHAGLTTVPPGGVTDLMQELGDDFDRAGIDQIGRRLKAEQVVYMSITDIDLYPQPGLLHPTAQVEVKVVDVINKKRMFPTTVPGMQGQVQSLAPPGYKFKVRLSARGIPDHKVGLRRAVEHQLALRIARDASRLFFDYLPRQPGEPPG